MIKIDITKRHGEFLLDAHFMAHGIIHIYGPNGSGKTTLLKCIAGLVKPDSGEIIHNGNDLTDIPIEKRRAIYIDRLSFFPSLEVDAHLLLAREATESEVAVLKDLIGINYGGRVKNLSTGQRLKVSIATAILSHPRMILLDEVSANISDAGALLSSLNDVLSEHGIDLINTAQEDDPRLQRDVAFKIDHGKLSEMEH